MNPFVIESSALVATVLGLSAAGLAAIPRLPVNLKALRKSGEQGFDSLLVTEYLIACGITFNEDGAFTTGWTLTWSRRNDPRPRVPSTAWSAILMPRCRVRNKVWMYEHRTRAPALEVVGGGRAGSVSAIADASCFTRMCAMR